MKVNLKKLADKLPEFDFVNLKDVNITGVSYDSRTIDKGDIFFPLKGDNFDGHDFIPNAFDGGAVVCMCDSEHFEHYNDRSEPIIVVNNIEEGLEKIVNVLFSDILTLRVGITGSTGKTTTRQMLVKILKDYGTVLSSDRNFNTLWGNAKLLSEYDGEDYIVMEIAMDMPGEIAWQCRALEPDLGAILNIGYVHSEKLGGIKEVYESKKDLADYLHRTGKPLVLNVDDEWLQKIPKNFTSKLITYGRKGNDFKLLSTDISIDGTFIKFEHEGKKYETSIKAHGTDLSYNMLAAMALAELLGVSVEDSVKSIKGYGGYLGRFYLHKINDELTIVNDAYNANPTSMKMAINTFDEIFDKSYERIVILGDMKELGDVTKREHRKLGELVESKHFDYVYYLGDYYTDFGVGEELINIEQAELILARLKNSKRKKVAVLLKASHSIGLYDIVNFIT